MNTKPWMLQQAAGSLGTRSVGLTDIVTIGLGNGAWIGSLTEVTNQATRTVLLDNRLS